MRPIGRLNPSALTPKSGWVQTGGLLGKLGLLSLVACLEATNDSRPDLTYNTMVRYTVGEATSGLDKNGRFQLYQPTGSSEISQQQAMAFAALWPKQFGRWVVRSLEYDHGGPIAIDSLRVCGTTYYMESAFEPLGEQLEAQDPAHARVFGPWWLVTLCGHTDQPQVSLAVAAYSTDLRIERGEIVMPRVGGEWFSWEGIPKDVGFDFVESPERLVQRTGDTYGRRVTKVPELIAPLRQDGFPNHPRWRLALDAPLTAVGKSREYHNLKDIHSWRRPGSAQHDYQIPVESQPDEVTFHYPDPVSSKDPDGPLKFLEGFATRRSGVPVLFESVTLQDGN